MTHQTRSLIELLEKITCANDLGDAQEWAIQALEIMGDDHLPDSGQPRDNNGASRTPLAEALDYMEFFISETQSPATRQPDESPCCPECASEDVEKTIIRRTVSALLCHKCLVVAEIPTQQPKRESDSGMVEKMEALKGSVDYKITPPKTAFDHAIDRCITFVNQHTAPASPVSLEECARAIWKLGRTPQSDWDTVPNMYLRDAKAVLDFAGVAYE